MQVEGITWHAVTLAPEAWAATKKLVTDTFGQTPMMEMDGVSVFQFPNGTLLEL